MNRRLWPIVACCIAMACESNASPDEVALDQAPLFGKHVKRHLLKAWKRHLHKPDPSCPGGEGGEPGGPGNPGGPGGPAASSCKWTSYERGLIGANAFSVVFDERERGVAYAVSGGAVWQSTDSGETWSPRGDTGANIVRLVPDGPDPSDLLAVTSGGLKASSNAGANWKHVSLTGLPIEYFDSPVAQPQRVYANVDGGPLLISNDGGELWNLAGVNYPRGDTFGVSVDPRSPLDVLVAIHFYRPELANYAGRGAIFHSADGGVTWAPVYEPNVQVHALVRCPVNPDLLLAGTRAGVARSFDNGATWTLTPVASTTEGITGLAVNPKDCDDYYALQANVGPIHTRDGGASFSAPLVSGLQLAKIAAFPGNLVVDPEDAAHLILSTHAGFYTSHDSGEHWSELPIMLNLQTTGIAVSPHNPSEVWISTWGQGVWRRSSENEDWERLPVASLPRDFVASLALDPTDRRVLIGANPPLFSADGESFSDVGTYSTATSAAFHPSDPSIVYVTTQIDGVLKSEDAGITWRQINEGLPTWLNPASLGIDTRAIVVNPARPEQLFVATYGNGIYKSEDGGESWTQLYPSSESAACLTFVPSTGGGAPRLYACLSGVTASLDGGTTWTLLTDGLPSLNVQQLVHDAATDSLYATTPFGVYVLDAGETSWRILDPGCEHAARGLAIMEEGGRRFLVLGADHGIRRIAL